MASRGSDETVVPKADYRKVFGLFRYYHRAAITLAAVSIVRSALSLTGPDALTGVWIDRVHFVLCATGGAYVVAPYTRRFLEMIALVRNRH
jgi:hypothetical protein